MIRQLLTAPNQLTLLRLIFVPFVVITIVEGRYGLALVILGVAGLTDLLDGLTARLLHQHTVLGEYLDPIADKLLLSTLFVVLSVTHKMPWSVTVLVFIRDIFILVVSGALYATGSLREFQPSFLGKANTTAQIVTIFLVLLWQVERVAWVGYLRTVGIWTTMALTILSGTHYALRTTRRIENRSAGNR